MLKSCYRILGLRTAQAVRNPKIRNSPITFWSPFRSEI
jgi:hypothetical protein